MVARASKADKSTGVCVASASACDHSARMGGRACRGKGGKLYSLNSTSPGHSSAGGLYRKILLAMRATSSAGRGGLHCVWLIACKAARIAASLIPLLFRFSEPAKLVKIVL